MEDAKPVEVRVNAVSDHPRYECQLAPINFKNTLMFQSRSYSLPFRNTSNASVEISWFVVHSNLKDEDEEIPFTVTPNTASVLPNDTMMFNVKFNPLEGNFFNSVFLLI